MKWKLFHRMSIIILLVATLSVLCSTAFAEKWMYVTTADDNSDVYIDADNVIGTDFPNNQIGIVVPVKYIGGKTAEELGYSYAIDEMIFVIHKSNYSMACYVPKSTLFDYKGRKIKTLKDVVQLMPLTPFSTRILKMAEPNIKWVK